jgi:hypothetical protein
VKELEVIMQKLEAKSRKGGVNFDGWQREIKLWDDITRQQYAPLAVERYNQLKSVLVVRESLW